MTARTQGAVGWNQSAHLRCSECGTESALDSFGKAGKECSERCLIEVVYDTSRARQGKSSTDFDSIRTDFLPIRHGSRIDLGQGRTPLAKLGSLGRALFLKNETSNPTWSHKDRGHSIAIGAAKLLRARGIVTRSTGNHGASAAAYAAAAGLPSLVFCHPRMPELLVKMITSYGGVAVTLPPSDEQRLLVQLVNDGWFPSTSMDPEVSGRSNPFGAEAYKDVAIEIIEALGRSPRAMIVPTAGGDTIYGVAKGFAAAHDQLGTRMPKVIAVQPRSANSLERSLKIGTTVNVPRAKSVALSLSDERVGRQGLLALQRWHGSVVSVSEKAIKEATRDFARAGFLLEPASAATLAGYRQALNKHLVTPADSVVLLATASGAKWAASLPGMYGNGRFTTRKAVLRALKEVG